MIKIKIPILLICSVIIFILIGSKSGEVTTESKDFPKCITVREDDVMEIRTWGKDNGESGKGELLDKVKASVIIRWVNSAKIIGAAKLPPEMKAPKSLINIYLTNDKIIQVFLLEEDLILDSYRTQQNDLTEFLKQNTR